MIPTADDAVTEVLVDILRLARQLKAEQKRLVFIDYSPHVDWLTVAVYPATAKFTDEPPRFETRVDVYLSYNDPLPQLRNIRADLEKIRSAS